MLVDTEARQVRAALGPCAPLTTSAPQQVQIVWMKHAVARVAQFGEFPKHAQQLEQDMSQIVRLLKERLWNLQLAWLWNFGLSALRVVQSCRGRWDRCTLALFELGGCEGGFASEKSLYRIRLFKSNAKCSG